MLREAAIRSIRSVKNSRAFADLLRPPLQVTAVGQRFELPREIQQPVAQLSDWLRLAHFTKLGRSLAVTGRSALRGSGKNIREAPNPRMWPRMPDAPPNISPRPQQSPCRDGSLRVPQFSYTAHARGWSYSAGPPGSSRR